jgi:hypothetical protein
MATKMTQKREVTDFKAGERVSKIQRTQAYANGYPLQHLRHAWWRCGILLNIVTLAVVRPAHHVRMTQPTHVRPLALAQPRIQAASK